MLLYDILFDDSGFPEQDRQLLMTCDSAILADNLFDYCTKMGVLTVKSHDKRFLAVNVLDIKP